MRKIRIIQYALSIAVAMLLASCQEEEMMRYAEAYAINFDRLNAEQPELRETINFAERFNRPFDIKGDTIVIKVSLQGKLSENPLKFAFKMLQDTTQTGDKLPLPDAVFENPYTFAPKEFLKEVKIYINRPKEMNKLYTARVTFDYDKSDVIAGVNERRFFSLSVKDELTPAQTKLTREIWDSQVSVYFGAYSNVKLRFIAHALKRTDLSILPTIENHYEELIAIANALKKYNGLHPNDPLKDENGELVKFNFN